MYAAARSLMLCHDGPTIVQCTSANAAALVVVALVDDAHLQPGDAFSVAPVPALDGSSASSVKQASHKSVILQPIELW